MGRRYEDLAEDRDLQGVAERAFGREGLGIAVVTGVPDISQLRRDLFASGQRYDGLLLLYVTDVFSSPFWDRGHVDRNMKSLRGLMGLLLI